MIKIKENSLSGQSEGVFMILDDNSEIIFDSYPVVIKPNHMTPLVYKATVLEKKHK
jgi:hypothetical protein